jgi:hypothetical protein
MYFIDRCSYTYPFPLAEMPRQQPRPLGLESAAPIEDVHMSSLSIYIYTEREPWASNN